VNKVPFELQLKRRVCCKQTYCPSMHHCVWLAWALTLARGSPTSVGRKASRQRAGRCGKMGTLAKMDAKFEHRCGEEKKASFESEAYGYHTTLRDSTSIFRDLQ